MQPRPSALIHLVCLTALLAAAPAPNLPLAAVGAEVGGPANAELSPAAEQALWAEIQHNLAALRRQGVLAAPSAQAVPYNFPLRLAPGLPDYAGFRVSAFVDHNPAGSQVLDYNGGTRTYDGHRGTDYGLWPYGWNKLDAGDVHVIAAAAGTIVAKSDANPADHSCTSSSGNWNYVALTHADGRMTIYGHMRYGSVTQKGIGQTVAQGEYLGTAASSGNSSGPHLHFEVRTGSFKDTEWVDPYAGPHSQPETLWASQRPYYDSAINRLTTHAAQPIETPCQPTATNLQDSFSTPARIQFYTYYRDYRSGLTTQFNIYRPDGSVFQTWQDIPADNIFFSGRSLGRPVDLSAAEPAGTWRFEAVYNGTAYETFFNVNAPAAISVTSPNGGEQWETVSAHPITWADNLGGAVNLTLYYNGVYSATLAANLPSTGAYLWTPAPPVTLGSGYTLRVTSVINPNVSDVSDAAFSLTEARLAARDDLVMTALDTPLTIDVLYNDLQPAGDPAAVTALGAPLSGTVSLAGPALVYTPTLGFLGTDVFTYTVSTGAEAANATVTVLVVTAVTRLFLPTVRR